jgi:DNA-directed RNA polymerase beta subunit
MEKSLLPHEKIAYNTIITSNRKKKEDELIIRLISSSNVGTNLYQLSMNKNFVIHYELPHVFKDRDRNVIGKKSMKRKTSRINIIRLIRLMMYFRLILQGQNPENYILDTETIKQLLRPFINEDDFNDVYQALLSTRTEAGEGELYHTDIALLFTAKYSLLNDNRNIQNFNDVSMIIYQLLQENVFTFYTNSELLVALDFKLQMLLLMLSRYLQTIVGKIPIDDINSWENKRMATPGVVFETLLKSFWNKKVVNEDFRSRFRCTYADNVSINEIGNRFNSLLNYIGPSLKDFTSTFANSMSSGSFGITGGRHSKNITQPLQRTSSIDTRTHIDTIDVDVEGSGSQAATRKMQNSQYNAIDPISTPEGAKVGLTKVICMTVRYTLSQDDSFILNYLQDSASLNYGEKGKHLLLVHGKFLGWCDGRKTRELLIEHRRQGRIHYETGISLTDDNDRGLLLVEIRPGRLIFPLLIVNPQTQKLIIEEKNLWKASISVLLQENALEYISVRELQYCRLAYNYQQLTEATEFSNEKYPYIGPNTSSNIFTHAQIDPKTMLSLSCSLIIWGNHNPSARNTYQYVMSKQALSTFNFNHANRMGDGKTKLLLMPQRALIESQTTFNVGMQHKGFGSLANLAFLAVPHTPEDAYLIGREYLDRGALRMWRYFTYNEKAISKGEIVQKFVRPKLGSGDDPLLFQYLQDNGLPVIGATLQQGDCVLGRVEIVKESNGTERTKNISIYLGVGDFGTVTSVRVLTGKEVTVIVKLRIMRIPIEGDKYAARCAQKNTIGARISKVKLPYDARGVSPDIIQNSMSIPSRMTISELLEQTASKAAAFYGQRFDGSPFSPADMNKYQKILRERKFDEYGYEKMTSALTGYPLSQEVAVGPILIQALKHHVADKYQARGIGKYKSDTRQPVHGRRVHGGTRFGEMERDAAISYGASAFLRERTCYASDKYELPACRKCGIFAVVNKSEINSHQKLSCPLCGDDNTPYEKKFCKLAIPYTLKLLIHTLLALGFLIRFNFNTQQIVDDSGQPFLSDEEMDEIENDNLEEEAEMEADLEEI